MGNQPFTSKSTYDKLRRYKMSDFNLDKQRDIDRWLVWVERFANRSIGKETRLLEIGLGSGEVVCYLAERIQAAGLEPSPIYLDYVRRKARERNLRIDLRKGAAEDVPFAFVGQKFDIILMQSVLEHVKEYHRALANVFEHLSLGGIFLFNTTNKFRLKQGEYNIPPFFYSYLPNSCRYAIRRWRQGNDIMEHGIDFHQFIPEYLKRELEQLGFRRIFDRLEIMEEIDVIEQRRFLFNAIKNNHLLGKIYRLFYSDTFFICEK